jgi:haloacetate dehalogenase
METAMDRKYFPHFKQEMVDVGDGVSINALAGGQGKEALLLLHGHPETHLIWRFMAEQLAEKYFVVLADMRGYGDSSKPVGLPDHSNYSKRVMAQDMIRVMVHFGFQKFHAAGHDRGARVLHRLVLDAPETVWSCTLMDILPTYDMYADTNEEFATKYWHWFFYIQGNGFPERLLAADPDYFIHYNLNLKIGPAARENFPKRCCRSIHAASPRRERSTALPKITGPARASTGSTTSRTWPCTSRSTCPCSCCGAPTASWAICGT